MFIVIVTIHCIIVTYRLKAKTMVPSLFIIEA